MNWQAYLDGSMDSSERVLAESLLERDPAARAELDALRRFIAEIHSAGRSVSSGTTRIAPLIGVAQRQAKMKRLAVGLSLAACLAMAFAFPYFKKEFTGNGEFSLARGKTTEIVNSPDPAAVKKFSDKKLRFAPLFSSAKTDAKLKAMRSGSDWVCYDFMYHNAAYTLEVSLSQAAKAQCGTASKVINGVSVYEHSGLTWVSGGIAYQVTGGSPEGRWQMVNLILPIAVSDDANQTIQAR